MCRGQRAGPGPELREVEFNRIRTNAFSRAYFEKGYRKLPHQVDI